MVRLKDKLKRISAIVKGVMDKKAPKKGKNSDTADALEKSKGG